MSSIQFDNHACSNITNRQDPASLKSRLFLGNLNTVKMARTEVEQVFARYGPIVGISLHKGYGFVQYGNEYHARMAVKGEDNKIYYGMALDVTIASEPKTRKRGRPYNMQNCNPHGLMDVMQAQALAAVGGQLSQLSLPGSQMAHNVMNQFPNILNNNLNSNFGQNQVFPVNSNTSGAKRTRLDANSMMNSRNKNLVSLVSGGSEHGSRQKYNRSHHGSNNLRNISTHKSNSKKEPSLPSQDNSEVKLDDDILLCGKCRKCFEEISEFMAHKMAGCSLTKDMSHCKAPGEPDSLDCAYCRQNFITSWELISHCQKDHGLTIYSLPDKQENSSAISSNVSSRNQSPVRDNGENDESHEHDENGSTKDAPNDELIKDDNDEDLSTKDECLSEVKIKREEEEEESSEPLDVPETQVVGSKRKSRKVVKIESEDKEISHGKTKGEKIKAVATKRTTRNRTRRTEETGRHENVSDEDEDDEEDSENIES